MIRYIKEYVHLASVGPLFTIVYAVSLSITKLNGLAYRLVCCFDFIWTSPANNSIRVPFPFHVHFAYCYYIGCH